MKTFDMIFLAALTRLSVASVVREVPEYLTRYGVVLDAGSSGTRVRVYQYTIAKNALHFTDMAEIGNKKVKPGLDRIGSDSYSISTYISELINFAKEKVPRGERKWTNIYVFATAGMRSIRPRDKAEKIMSNVRSLLANRRINPFAYWSPSQVQILSGEEEGAYAWVALNYLKGVFEREGGADQTYGVMEMGGASMQIAYLPEREPLAEEFAVTVAGRKYSLYVHSYLGFGLNAIVEKMTDDFNTVTNTNEPGITVKENPCFLNDDTKLVTSTSGETVKYVGTGNPTLCKANIAKHMEYQDVKDAEEYCNPSPCAILDTYQPRVPQNMTFYLKGGFEYVIGHFDLAKTDKTFNMTALQMASDDYCPLPFQQAKVNFPKTPDFFLSNRCLLGEYAGLIFEKLGPFGPMVKATSKVHGVSIDWTLGALVLHQYERLTGIREARENR